MHLTVARAEPRDAAEMADVVVASSLAAYTGLVSSAYLEALTPVPLHLSYHRSVERGDVFWVARDGRTVVGMARAGDPREVDPPRTVELRLLYVLPSHFGSGAGQLLLDAAIGSDPCMLWVATANPRAIAFYRRNGFVFDGATKSIEAVEGIEGSRMVR